VAHIFPYAGAEKQSGNLFAIAVGQDARRGSVEQSTTREADDVMQKPQRAGDGAVLIVDDAVQMTFVGMRYELARCGKIAVSPGSQFQPVQAVLSSSSINSRS
jgi:hypothetical protein